MKQILSLVSAVLIFAVGCTTFNLQETLKETAVIAPHQAITVLPQGPSSDDMDFAECVSRTVQRTSPSLRFISTQEFRDALFPWFEPGTAPDTLEELASLLNKPLVDERIASLGVRYVIRVGGATIQQPFEGPIFCGVGPGGGGCIGYIAADRESHISATIWDLEEADSPGTVDVEASGTIVVPAFILPFFVTPAMTETYACSVMGERLAGFISGEKRGGDDPIDSLPGLVTSD